MESNQEIIKNIISKHPGLRFHEIKKESKLANGTIQHHISRLSGSKSISTKYLAKIPRYYPRDVKTDSQTILLRLRQNTTSRVIKSLLEKDCLTFAQIVKYSKKAAGTVSVYKNMLLKDGIIVGNTNECDSCPDAASKIKYRLVDSEKIRTIVKEYGQTYLQESAENLDDIFLSIK